MVDNHWWSLRKGSSLVYIVYGLNPGAKLYATNLQMQKGPPVTISMDLGSNLRKRSKLSNLRIDAEDLAEKIGELKRIELSDSGDLDRLTHHLKFADD
jgi:hypothetical protein